MLDPSQLVTASIATYGIGTDAGVDGVSHIECVGFMKKEDGKLDITTFEAGIDKIDACYVGETADDIVLAFRGTAMKKQSGGIAVILDWLNNFAAGAIEAKPFPGKVHKGFHRSVMDLVEKKFPQEVERRLKNCNYKKKVYVTGYSKGAALTPLAAWWLLYNDELPFKIKADQVYIFEPPKCGDDDFKEAFEKDFPQTVRYEYKDDIVPHVPPSDMFLDYIKKHAPLFYAGLKLIYPRITKWDYTPVGTLNFADWENKIIHEAPGLDQQRLESLVKVLTGEEPATVLEEHLPCGHLFDILSALDPAKCKDCPVAPPEHSLKERTKDMLDAQK